MIDEQEEFYKELRLSRNNKLAHRALCHINALNERLRKTEDELRAYKEAAENRSMAWLANALEQYTNGDVITVPAGDGTEEEFFAWLKDQGSAGTVPEDISVLIEKVRKWGVEHTGNEPSVSCFHRALDELQNAVAAAILPPAMPAVAVPDFETWWRSLPSYRDADKPAAKMAWDYLARLVTSQSHSQQSAQRITEQDAQEIVTRYTLWRGTEYSEAIARQFIGGWLALEGNKLIAKLNSTRAAQDYKPAVAVPDEVRGAIERLDRTQYRVIARSYRAGEVHQSGYTGRNIRINDMTICVEYIRDLLSAAPSHSKNNESGQS